MSGEFGFDTETRRQILASKSFQAEAFAPADRLAAFEQFVYGETTGFLGQPRLVSLSDANENFNQFRRLTGEDIHVSDTITSGYSVRAQDGPASDPHDNLYISLCLSGSGQIQTEQGEKKICEGDIYLNLSRNYRFWFGAGASRRIVFPKRLIRELSATKDELLILRKDDPVTRLVRSTADAVAFALSNRDACQMKITRDLMVSVSQRIIESTFCNSAGLGHNHNRDRAITYIKENLHRSDLTIPEIANYLNVSRATLYRAFESTGGLKDFIISERVQRARTALSAGRTDRGFITSIAYDTGFRAPEQFSKAFKARTGLTPTQFVQSGMR